MPNPTQTTLTPHLENAAGRVPISVHSRLPPWLGEASSARRDALKTTRLHFADWLADANRQQHTPLKEAMDHHWTTQNQLDSALAALESPQAFAAPLLHQALKTRFGIERDVSTTFLRLYAPLTIPLFPIETGGVKAWTVSLVDAALHNFDATEGQPAAYTDDSTFITQPSATGQFDTLPAVTDKISIVQFVGLCRELDIGAQYQRYLKGFFGFQNATLQASLRSKVIANLKAEALTCVQMARLKKDASESTLRTLRAHLSEHRGLTLQGKTLLNHDLSLMGAPLTGVVLFAADLESHQTAVPVVAYIPGDPQAPLKYYANGTAFMRDLADKLRAPDYQAFFSRFVNQEHRGYFFADLNNRLSHIVWHPPQPGDPRPTWHKEPVAKPNLQFYATKIPGELFEHLYQSKLNKLLNDARALAVPTADADSKARWQRWDIVQKVGKAILEIAAFIVTPFVPPLGALMLGYSAYQLLDEVFEGIIDWAEGLKREALEHLMSITEQMVQLGLFAVGAPIAQGLLRQALPKKLWDFFDSLTPVTDGDKTRLWPADLAPYAHDIQLPPESRPSDEGLHAHADKQILALNGQHFSIQQEAGSTYLGHPGRTHAYRPRISGNGKGAWLMPTDRPLTWDRNTLLRRLGAPADELTEARLEWAHRISGSDDGALRKLYMDRQPAPGLLADTLKRVAIDQHLQDFIDQMNSDDPQQYQKADTQTQLWLLSQTSLWPETKTLRFLNAKGETVWEHRGREDAAVAQIHEAQMKNGDLLKTLLETLNESERKTLLEEPFGTPAAQLHVRAATLRKRLARQARNRRAGMFDSRYRGLETTRDPRVQKIIDSAPGLPISVAQEVLFGATGQELLEMDQGILPQRLRDLAHWAAHEVRISRAYEGLYMEALESGDTQRLALHSLENLPGWSPLVRLEVRNFRRTGALRDAVGPPEGSIQRILVRTIEGQYIPEDGKGTLFGETDLYTAVIQALPDTQRDELGMQIGQGPLLQNTLRQYALGREPLGELLATDPVRKPNYDPTLMRLPGGMEGYGAVAPNHNLEAQLLRELYPSLNQEQTTYLLSALHTFAGSPLQTLQYLKSEFSQLETVLASWCSNLSEVFLNPQVPLFSSTVAEERLHRWIWTHQLIRAWRHETPQDTEFASGRQLHLTAPTHGELPVLSANFDHISNLGLRGYPTTRGAPAFVARFPNLRTLAINDIALNTLPPEVMALPHLNSLTLRNCNINLTLQSRAQLALMTRLKNLDLSNNRQLSLSPNLGQMPELQTLNLSHTYISLFPEHLLTRLQLTSANLSNNYLSRLPEGLFNLPAQRARVFNLSGNPLSRVTLEKIKTYCQTTGEHFGADANPAERRLVQELYPTYSANQANNLIFRLPGGLNNSMAILERLKADKADYERLQADLGEWVLDVPERYPFINTPIDEGVRAQQQILRRQAKAVLEAGWRGETRLDSSQEPPTSTHELKLNLPLLGDLPALNINFKHVSKMELAGEQTTSIPQGFLERFPNLETLNIRGYALSDIPAGVFNLTQLKTLIIYRSRVQLTATSAAALSDLHTLQYLDLSGNPLGLTPDVSKMTGLTGLLIEDAGLTEVPNGTFNLPLLGQLDLRDNQITELPTDILEVEPDRAEGFVLSGNTFSPETITLLVPYYHRHAVDFEIPEVRQRAQLNPTNSTDTSEDESEQ